MSIVDASMDVSCVTKTMSFQDLKRKKKNNTLWINALCIDFQRLFFAHNLEFVSFEYEKRFRKNKKKVNVIRYGSYITFSYPVITAKENFIISTIFIFKLYFVLE